MEIKSRKNKRNDSYWFVWCGIRNKHNGDFEGEFSGIICLSTPYFSVRDATNRLNKVMDEEYSVVIRNYIPSSKKACEEKLDL